MSERAPLSLPKKIGCGIVAVIVGVLLVCLAYLSDYQKADAYAASVQQQILDQGQASLGSDGSVAYAPSGVLGDGEKVGVIFYPGAKVDETAYAPLAQACAARGITFVVCPMPFHFALLGMNEGDEVRAQHPEITDWYLAGHSLGGVAAAQYAAKHADDVDGVILLASYSTADLNESGLCVLSIYGDQDSVLNAEQYEASQANLPKDTLEVVLAGANHAGFGNYGAQKGDSPAIIGQGEQIEQTADAIAEFIEQNEAASDAPRA